MQLRGNSITEWQTNEPLRNGEDRLVEVGNINSGLDQLSVRSHHFITFSIKTQLTCRLLIQGDLDPAFTAIDVIYTINVPAATVWTPYDMVAPWNQTGYLVIVKPHTRIRLLDTAAHDHSYTRLYLKAWG